MEGKEACADNYSIAIWLNNNESIDTDWKTISNDIEFEFHIGGKGCKKEILPAPKERSSLDAWIGRVTSEGNNLERGFQLFVHSLSFSLLFPFSLLDGRDGRKTLFLASSPGQRRQMLDPLSTRIEDIHGSVSWEGNIRLEKVARFLKFTRHGFRCSFASRGLVKRGGSKTFRLGWSWMPIHSLCHIVKNPWILDTAPLLEIVDFVSLIRFFFLKKCCSFEVKFIIHRFLLILLEANINLLNERIRRNM